ncbi:hypothetical protein BDZ97DRAFT_1901489 [Flammula alnicola]|nr:hypothetical protein BDZ97DRAFT_1901489 [Flammula alnicola]
MSKFPESLLLLIGRKATEINYTPLRQTPLFRARDIPLRCLYRLYEAVCSMSRNELMEESQYYFHCQPKWRLKDIPNPKDPDPQRQAILASLVETLVDSFNFKIGMGLRRGVTCEKPYLIAGFQRQPNPPYEEVPEWPASVEPLSKTLKMHPILVETPYPYFMKRNIVVIVDSLWNF